MLFFLACNTITQLAKFITLSTFADTVGINQGGKSELLMLQFTLSLASFTPRHGVKYLIILEHLARNSGKIGNLPNNHSCAWSKSLSLMVPTGQ